MLKAFQWLSCLLDYLLKMMKDNVNSFIVKKRGKIEKKCLYINSGYASP